MTQETDCATCGKDLLYSMPRDIWQWKSATDKRVFCSSDCLAKSTALPDTVTLVADADFVPMVFMEYDL